MYIEKDWIAKDLSELKDYYSVISNRSRGPRTLRSTIQPFVKKHPQAKSKKGVRAKDPHQTIDALCLTEASEYLNKALYCFLGYKYLQIGGYYSWALTTFYYSRFYLNNYLCRIQGQAILYMRPIIQLSRISWQNHIFILRRCPGKGGIHQRVWDLTKESFQDFRPTPPLSIEGRTIATYFNEKFFEMFGIQGVYRREELENREECTYDPFGFDELYYAQAPNWAISTARRDGRINYIDEKVFRNISHTEDFDGRGAEERGFGELLRFGIELASQINDAIGFKAIHLYWANLKELTANNETIQTIAGWIRESNL